MRATKRMPATWAMAMAGAWALAAGCATRGPDVKVEQQSSPEADFAAVATYRWRPADIAPTPYARMSRSDLDRAVRAAVDAELQRRGLRLVEEDPDVLVGYSAAVDKDLDLSAVNLQYGYAPGMGNPMRSGPGYRRYTPGWEPRGESVRFFEQGTLVLDIVDADSKSLWWRASAQAELHRDLPGPERESRLHEAVARMLEGFKE